jgi:hypothetical protein
MQPDPAEGLRNQAHGVDQHGAVIPKAEIDVEGKSKARILGVTGASGEWSQSKLTPGRYKVMVKAQGFSAFSSVIEVRDGAPAESEAAGRHREYGS